MALMCDTARRALHILPRSFHELQGEAAMQPRRLAVMLYAHVCT
jgi:hypothetical protein